MLRAEGKRIFMDEGDWGLSLPFKLSGNDILSTDVFQFKIKRSIHNEEAIVEKEFTNLSEKDGEFVFALDFTKEESNKLPEDKYRYGLKQYRDGELLNTVISDGYFEVQKGV